MKITSPVFGDKIPLPIQHTCDGSNQSPPLEFLDVPSGAESLVVTLTDLDTADEQIHWLVFNIPAKCTHFNDGEVPSDAVEAMVYSGKPAYDGPCPNKFSGIHRFAFRLYALRSALPIAGVASSVEVLAQARTHIIEHAELVALVQGTAAE